MNKNEIFILLAVGYDDDFKIRFVTAAREL